MPIDFLSALRAMQGIPKPLLSRMLTTAQLGNLYEDDINASLQPFIGEAEKAQTASQAASGALNTFQQAPLPELNPVADTVGRSVAGAADALAPGNNFVQKQADAAKAQLGRLHSQRAERLTLLEKAADSAAERAAKLGDMALQMKHLKDADRYAKMRGELIQTAGSYFEGQDKQALENQKFSNDLALQARKFRDELMVKYGTENPSPAFLAQRDRLSKQYEQGAKLIIDSANSEIAHPSMDPDKSRSPQDIQSQAMQQLARLGSQYEAGLAQLTGGEAPPPVQQQRPVDMTQWLHEDVIEHINHGHYTFNDYDKTLQDKDANGNVVIRGEDGSPAIGEDGSPITVPYKDMAAQARRLYKSYGPLLQEAKSLAEDVKNNRGPFVPSKAQRYERIRMTLTRHGIELPPLGAPQIKGIGVEATPLQVQ